MRCVVTERTSRLPSSRLNNFRGKGQRRGAGGHWGWDLIMEGGGCGPGVHAWRCVGLEFCVLRSKQDFLLWRCEPIALRKVAKLASRLRILGMCEQQRSCWPGVLTSVCVLMLEKSRLDIWTLLAWIPWGNSYSWLSLLFQVWEIWGETHSNLGSTT